MPQPTAYTRQYNFTDRATSNPSDPLPGSQVDAELNQVKTNLDGLNTNIGLIQRDDGKLGNASVGTQQFDNGALALIGASGSGFTIKGDWAASTAYVVGDVVENSQATYYCSIAHTSGNAFSDNDTKFVLIANAAISSAAIQVEKFTGDNTTTQFTLSTTYGSDKDVMVFVGGSLRTPQSESSSTDTASYSISGTTLTFVTAPPNSSTPNVFVWGTSVSVEAARQSALASANTASGHSVDAGQHRDTASFWAQKVDGTVVDSDTSVDSNDYSAKAYSIAVGTPTTIYVTVASSKFVLNGKTISSGSDSIYNIVKGTTYTFDVSDSTNSGHQLEFSTSAEDATPDYTVTRSGTAGQSGATVTFAVPSDAAATVYFYCSVSGHSGMGATLSSIAESYAPTSGSSKEWASKTDGQVSGSEYSSKAYANSTDVNEPPTGSSKSWATQDTTAVDSSLFSAKEYASGTSATGGTAKEWAQKSDGAVDTEFSAKAYASLTGTNAPTEGSAKEWATNAGSAEVKTSEGYSAKAYAQDTAASADTTGGSAKGWAATAKNTAVPGASSSDRSAKHYSEIAADEATNALNQNRFLSPKSDSNVPTTRDDGTTALSAGDMYFNTTQNKMKIRNANNAWQDTCASIDGVASTTEFTGSQATYSKWFAMTHDVGLQIVWLNGIRLVQGSDYYSVNSNTSTTNIASGEASHLYFISNVASTDVISVMAFGQITSTAVVAKSGGTFTGAVTFEGQNTHNTGSNTFTMPTTRGTDNYVLTRDDSAGTGGTTWKATELAPATTSISPTELESHPPGGGNITFTLTGTNYASSGMSVHFLATSGSDITSGMTVTHTSSTSLSVEIARSSFVDANEPYSIKVTKVSGLTHTLDNALRVDNAPSFSTYVGTLIGSPPVVASVNDNIDSATHATLSAVDAESDAVTYSETTSTLTNAGMTLSSAGAITGAPTDVTSDTNYDFTARATSTGDGGATTKTTDQNFRFTITPPPQLFAGVLWTGNNTDRDILFTGDYQETYTDGTTSRDFRPDLVWTKHRSGGNNHKLADSVRTAANSLTSSVANPENYSNNGKVGSFLTNGFSVEDQSSNNDDINFNGYTYIGYCWKAGGAPSGSLGTIDATTPSGAGTITQSSDSGYSLIQNATDLTQSVNRDSGFSITKFKGSASGCTIPHNLGGTPEWFMIKNLDQTQSWACWHKNLSATTGYRISLDLDDPELQQDAAGKYFPTAPNSTTITCGSDDGQGGSTDEFICYAWRSIPKLSSFGTYEGDGGSVRTITTGFRPRFVMLKNIDVDGTYWPIVNTYVQTGDTITKQIYADLTNAEDTGTHKTMTFSSTGFGFTAATTYDPMNQNGKTFIYMAFA